MKVKSINRIKKEKTFDLSIEDNHNYFVGESEILVHNSGKDGHTKVDRSSAYASRYIAKNIVESGLSDTCKVTLSYMIGVPDPSSIDIEVSSDIDVNVIEKFIRENVDLTPKGISDRFNLKQPMYYNTARYGHYGNDYYPWEQTDLSEKIKKLF